MVEVFCWTVSVFCGMTAGVANSKISNQLVAFESNRTSPIRIRILKLCRSLLLGYPKVILYTKFEHLRIICFWIMPRLLVWKNPNCKPNPNLWPFNPKTISLLRHVKVIPYTKSEQFGIIHFWVILWTKKNKQTDRQTDQHSQCGSQQYFVHNFNKFKCNVSF